VCLCVRARACVRVSDPLKICDNIVSLHFGDYLNIYDNDNDLVIITLGIAHKSVFVLSCHYEIGTDWD
jgi:hypothetical protein